MSKEIWGTFAERFADPTRSHRLLSLDGGGIRGVVTLSILQKIEDILRATRPTAEKESFRLCDWFDYIAGTSTGAIIAAGLARGMKVSEIATFYDTFAAEAFEPRPILERRWSRYGSGALATKLRQVFGNATLEPTDNNGFKSLLLVVTKNVTTDSPWPISNNPFAKYNNTNRADCNLRLPLFQLVRASTAAPTYFPPETVILGDRSFVFVDGGTTPYNNPSFLLYRFATLPEYQLNWPTGEDNLLMVSVGTGSAPDLGPLANDREENFLSAGKRTLFQAMYHAQVEQDLACRTVGRCVTGPFIDREVRTMSAPGGPPRAFRYARYDVDLSPEGLIRMDLGDIDPEGVQQLDAHHALGDLKRIGQWAAGLPREEHLY